MKKNFEEIFSEIYTNYSEHFLQTYNKKFRNCLKLLAIISIITIIIYNLAGINSAGFFAIAGGIIIFFLVIKIQDKYIEDYKKNIISKLVTLYHPKLKYYFDLGLERYDYISSKIPEKFDDFKSTDLICGKIIDGLDFKMSYIKTYRKEYNKNDKNDFENVETFKGIFCCAKMSKTISSEIIIDINDFKKKDNLNRIEFESVEFEKKFDCFSNNKIIALQILTPDVVEQINKLCVVLKNAIQIRINNDKIFLRFMSNELFIPQKFKNPFDGSSLRKIYDAIYISSNLVECIFNSIDENI